MKSLSWISHPAKERPVAAAMVIVLVLGVFYLVYSATQNTLMVLIAVLIFLISLSTFFFPTRYNIDEKRVTIKYLYTLKERNVSAFRTVYPGRRGILLSPFLGPSRLENYRGFYLRYGRGNKVEVDKFLAELIQNSEEAKAVKSSTEGLNGA